MSARHGVVVLAEPEDEGELVRAIDMHSEDMRVVRRCADLLELRAAIRAGVADLAVISALELELDALVVDELKMAGAGVVLVIEEQQRAEALRLGAHALSSRGAPEQVVEALLAHIRGNDAPITTHAEPHGTLMARDGVRLSEAEELAAVAAQWDSNSAEPEPDAAKDRPPARLIVVWGTSGAPGRSTIALGLAHALSHFGDTLLVDADVSNPSLAHMCGVNVDASGLAALARRSSRGSLDAQNLEDALIPLSDNLSLLTGLSSPHRWREVAPGALGEILALARTCRSFVVVDVAPTTLESVDGEFHLRGSRDAVTLGALRAASDLVCVARADVVGISRLSYALDWWKDNGSDIQPRVLVNRVSSSSTGHRPESALNAALSRILPGASVHLVAEDEAVAQGLLVGQSCVRAFPKSPSSLAIFEMAERLAQVARSRRHHRRRGRIWGKPSVLRV